MSEQNNLATIPANTFFNELKDSEVKLDNIQRIYDPLNGEELKKAIVAHVRKELDRTGQLLPHLVYEQPRWRFMIAIDWAAAANNELKLEAGEKDLPMNKVEGADVPKTLVEGHQNEKDVAPDDIRSATQQKIPVMQKAGNGSGTVVKVNPSALTGGKGK